MRCHYWTCDKTGEKILIPECWSVAISGDIDTCSCPKPIRTKPSKDEQIRLLEAEVESLKKKVKKLEEANLKLMKKNDSKSIQSRRV